MKSTFPRARGGFTLLEVVIALALLALIALNVQLVTKCGTTAARTGALRSSLESELELTLDRISFALMSAEGSEIEGPVPAPIHSSFVRYASVLGRDELGNVVLSPTQEIAWASHAEPGATAGGISAMGKATMGKSTMDGGRVTWTEDADALHSRRITWSNSVPLVYQGEVADNAADDNENGLLDEHGLAFSREGEEVRVFLTVEREDERGARSPVQRTLRIAPRN